MSKNIMNLYNCFSENNNNNNIALFNFNESEWNQLKQILPLKFLDLYISNDKIENIISKIDTMNREDIINFKLPTKPEIKSGDFGEMFSFVFLKDKNGEKYFCPKKWRWKSEKNKSAPFTDILLLHDNKLKPILISAECKTKATKNNSYSPLQNAIEGAKKDYNQRIIETLNWLMINILEELNNEDACKDKLSQIISLLDIYRKPVNYRKYEKIISAIAIIDSEFTNTELTKIYEYPENIIITSIILSIPKLKDKYEYTFEEMKKC